MRVLSSNDLLGLLPAASLVTVLEEALRDFAAGRVIVPARAHTEHRDTVLLTMPAMAQSAFGVKVVSVTPGNAKRGESIIRGLMTVSDGETGAPVGILDAAMLTAQRTGAIGALALKYTTPAGADRVGIVGTGVQGAWQAIFACAVRPVKHIYFVGRSQESAQRFTETLAAHIPSVRAVRCADVRGLLQETDVVVTATTSDTPVLPPVEGLLRNKHFLSIGSFKPSMRELPESVYGLAGQVVVDSAAATHEVGDLIQTLSAGVLRHENVIHLAELVTGKRSFDLARTTVVKSVGMALYDLYAARAFLAEADRVGRGATVEI